MFDLRETYNIIILVAILVVVTLLVVWFLRSRKSESTGVASSQGNQLYVGNLSYRVRERHLRDYFSEFGEIERLKIIKNHDTGRSKGFGFVTFESAASAYSALDCHGRDYEGRSLVVRMARPK